jgi:hypothetical protein
MVFQIANFYFIYWDMGKIKHKCFVNNKIGDFKFPKLEEQRKRRIEALDKCCTTLQNR